MKNPDTQVAFRVLNEGVGVGVAACGHGEDTRESDTDNALLEVAGNVSSKRLVVGWCAVEG